MSRRVWRSVVGCLRGWAGAGDDAASDRELLQRFAAGRDEAAFAALLRRHAGLVWGVCRRLLGQEQDAEDVFQATFLALAQRAGSGAWRESVAGWLHEAASRLAAEARRRDARRRRHEQASAARTGKTAEGHERRAELDEELGRLPEAWRLPLLLCGLEGLTRSEAARRLGWSLRTLERRLAEGRDRLRARLARCGLALAGALATARAAQAAPPGLAVTVIALGRAETASLARSLWRGTTMARLRLAGWLVLALGLAAAGGLAALPGAAPGPTEARAGDDRPTKPAEAPRPAVDAQGDPLPNGVLARMGSARLRHIRAADVHFAADGKTLLSFGGDDTVRTWDLATGKLLKSQRLPLTDAEPDNYWETVVLSPDGKTAARASQTHLHVWDAASGKERQRFPLGELRGKNRIESLAFTPDGQAVLISNGAGTVVLWDVDSGKERLRLRHPETIPSAGRHHAFSPDGKLLALVGDRQASVWELPSGKSVSVLRCDMMYPEAVFSPDGKTVALAGEDRASLWDPLTGARVGDLPAVDSRDWNHVAFSPDGQALALSHRDGVVLLDRLTLKTLRQLSEECGGRLRFSPDGKSLAGVREGSLRLWDVATGRELLPQDAHVTYPTALAYAPDGKTLASVALCDHTIRLWDAATGRPRRVLRLPEKDAWIRRLSFSADGRRLASCGDRTARLWDVETGKAEAVFQLPEKAENRGSNTLYAAYLAADGKTLRTLLLADLLRRPRWRLSDWEVDGGKLTPGPEWAAPAWPGIGPHFTDGKRLVLPVGPELIVLDFASGREQGRVPCRSHFPCIALSPDGRLLAVAADDTPKDGKETAEEARRREEGALLWDVSSRTLLATLDAGPGTPYLKAFTPDGRHLITTSAGALVVWETASGKEVLRRSAAAYDRGNRPPKFATCLAVAPDGRSVATGVDDGGVLVWDLAPSSRGKADLKAAEFDRLWADLAADAATAHRAVGRLSAAGEKAVALLGKRLQPAEVDARRIARLIADLDSEHFAEREAARKELEKLEVLAEPAVRKALAASPSAEQKRALEQLLPASSGLLRSPEALRQVRAVQALEWAGSREARDLLKRLASGAEGARLTREARAALDRLTDRP